MCSINGVFSSKDQLTKEAIFNAKKIQGQLKYRGTDYSDEFVCPTCALYSNVFSIVDRSHRSIPFYSENKKVVLIFNGEIYNYKVLRSELQNRGYIFNTESDTEVIMRSYEEYGENCFIKFKGMFAIAIFDQRKGVDKFLLARDRFGEKPLFYLEKNNLLYFASESLPLVDLPNKGIDVDGLAESFALGFSLNHIIKNVKRLPPSSYLRVTNNELEIKKYWMPEFCTDYSINQEKAILEYTNILSKTIIEMYPQEVESGVFLSGGVDSTLMSIVVNNYKKHTDCISSGLKGISSDVVISGHDSDFSGVEVVGNEFEKVKKISEVLNINLIKREFTADEYIDNFNNIVLHSPGGPAITTSPPLWFFAANKARELGKRTVFAGEGADELFCGYKTNNPKLYLNSQDSLAEKYSEIMGLCDKNELNRLFKDKVNIPYEKINQKIDDEFKGEGKQQDILMNKLRYMLGSGLVMCPHMLEKADGMTMAFPVEVRLPYLYVDSVEYIYKLPSELIIDNNQTKILLRKVAKKIGVPNFVIEEPKQRTSLPYYKLFFRSKYSSYFQNKILNKNALIKSVLNCDIVDKMALDDKNPRRLLSLLILESYLANFE